MRPTPPLLARLLLRLIAPREVYDEVARDLAESYTAHVARAGRLRARWRYWREVLSPTMVSLRREARGLPLAPGAALRSRSGDSLMRLLMRDLRYAIRVLWKSPGFTAVAILSLALGIGPNTAIFSVVNGFLLRDRGLDEPESLVEIFSLTRNDRHFAMGYSSFEPIRDGTKDVFSGVTNEECR